MNVLAWVALLSSPYLDSKPPTPELLAQARWVEVRVVRPANTPADERFEVVAHAVGLPKFNDFAVSVGGNGTFKVAFAHDARRGKLQLRARYAVLEEEPAWLPKADVREFELKPVIGAWLVGRVTSETASGRLRGGEVHMRGIPTRSGGRILERTTRPAADGAFEFGGLACDHEWSATVFADMHRPLLVDAVVCQPGRRTDVNWTVQRGVMLAGRVVNESGAGIVGAKLVFDCRSDPLAPLATEVASGLVSGVDGAFLALGLYPGDVFVRVEHVDHMPRSVEFAGLREGEMRMDLSIVLASGIVLHGKVVDPEGAPVAGAKLSITQARPGWSEYAHVLESSADGTFSIAGLSALPMRILGEKSSPNRVLRVDLSGVDPRAADLVVSLAERYVLKGRVLDDLGRTVLRYTAGVRRIDANDPTPKPRTIDVKSQDGVFAIDDLAAGPFEVFVYGRGLVFEPARRVEVPYRIDDLVFAVRRPAVVSGRVILADGSPAVRALVEVEWDRPAMFGGGMMKEQTSVTASHEGHFELTEIFPGNVRLRAVSEDGTARGTAAVDLVSGELRADVVVSIARRD